MLSAVIFLLFLTIFISGEPSLLIYKTVNGTNQQPIKAVAKVADGNNLTLKCKDATSTQNEVSWSRKTEYDFNPFKPLTNRDSFSFHDNFVASKDSKISFTPVKLGDGGVYVCTSTKTNVSRPIAIVVYDNIRRLKRTEYGIGALHEQMKTFKPGFPTVSADDPVGDFFKYNKKPVRPTSFPTWLEKLKEMNANLGLDESDNWPNYVRPGSNWYLSNLATGSVNSRTNTIFDDLYKKAEEKTIETQDSPLGSNQYTILYCMIIFGGLLLFGGIMCMCVRNNPNVRAHLDRTTSVSPACTHAMCVRHRDTNPLAGCILSTLNATNRIPTPMVHTNEDGDVTVLSFPDENVDSIDYDDVPDTPPSYSNTVDDLKSDLPPSYDEVLQNMLPPSYSTYQSTSTAIDKPTTA